MPKKVKYAIGDVFHFQLDNSGQKGYGRILKVDGETVFIELYKLSSGNKEYTLEDIKGSEVLLSIWSVDQGFRNGKWNIMGNIPVQGEVVIPDFWTTDAFTDEIFLIRGSQKIKITKEQIGNAKPYGIYGQEAVNIVFIDELAKCSLYSPPNN